MLLTTRVPVREREEKKKTARVFPPFLSLSLFSPCCCCGGSAPPPGCCRFFFLKKRLFEGFPQDIRSFFFSSSENKKKEG